jgi:hypothetical protein
MTQDNLHARLRRLVGNRFRYAGEEWTLIEILADADAVVLQLNSRGTRSVQTDLYGAPVRRSPETQTVPISAPDGGYSPALEDLLAGRIVGS